jgi:hypothetical protein
MLIETRSFVILHRVLVTKHVDLYLLHALPTKRINWSSECYAKLLCVLNFTLISEVGLLAALPERELSQLSH